MSTSVIADEFTSGVSEPEESPVQIAQEDSYSEGSYTKKQTNIYAMLTAYMHMHIKLKMKKLQVFSHPSLNR